MLKLQVVAISALAVVGSVVAAWPVFAIKCPNPFHCCTVPCPVFDIPRLGELASNISTTKEKVATSTQIGSQYSALEQALGTQGVRGLDVPYSPPLGTYTTNRTMGQWRQTVGNTYYVRQPEPYPHFHAKGGNDDWMAKWNAPTSSPGGQVNDVNGARIASQRASIHRQLAIDAYALAQKARAQIQAQIDLIAPIKTQSDAAVDERDEYRALSALQSAVRDQSVRNAELLSAWLQLRASASLMADASRPGTQDLGYTLNPPMPLTEQGNQLVQASTSFSGLQGSYSDLREANNDAFLVDRHREVQQHALYEFAMHDQAIAALNAQNQNGLDAATPIFKEPNTSWVRLVNESLARDNTYWEQSASRLAKSEATANEVAALPLQDPEGWGLSRDPLTGQVNYSPSDMQPYIQNYLESYKYERYRAGLRAPFDPIYAYADQDVAAKNQKHGVNLEGGTGDDYIRYRGGIYADYRNGWDSWSPLLGTGPNLQEWDAGYQQTQSAPSAQPVH